MPEIEQHIQTIEQKACGRCKLSKQFSEFYKDRRVRDGLSRWCKKCVCEYTRKRWETVQSDPDWYDAEKQRMRLTHKTNCRTPNPARKPRAKAQYMAPPEETGKKENTTKALNFYRGCFNNMYGNLNELGISENEIRKLCGTNGNTFDRYTKYDEQADQKFQEAMNELAGRLGYQMLVQAIGGYYYDEEETQYDWVANKWQESKKTIKKKRQPPNAYLFIHFMTNRFPDLWKVSKELWTGKLPTYDSGDRKKIESLARDVLTAAPTQAGGEPGIQGGLTRVSGEGNETGQK